MAKPDDEKRGRTAFEQIRYYEVALREAFKALQAKSPSTALELLRDALDGE